MRTFTALALAGSLLATSSSAFSIFNRRDASTAPKVVQHSIERRHIADPRAHDRARLAKRQGTVTASLENEETLYLMEVSVGTPAQSVKLHIDTGSSDLWVNVPTSDLCSGSNKPCSNAGTFDPSSSSTYTSLNDDFNITYADGSGASGSYATDTVAFSNVSISSQRIGVATQSDSKQGIIGIGYMNDEASIQYDHDTTYANVPQSLANDGAINTNAYSLWLNDLDASTGSILFGGIDTAQYTGSLETVPVVPIGQGDYAELIIELTGLGTNGNNGSIASGLSVAALLDSGTSLMYLPNRYVMDLYTTLNATYSESEGAAFIDCDMAKTNTTIDFYFNNAQISVALSEIILEEGTTAQGPVCLLGIGPNEGSDLSILGDTFLRSAYVVYDLTENEISLAQTDFGATGTDISEIPKGGVSSMQGTGSTSSSSSSSTTKSAAGIVRPSWVLAAVAVIGAGLLF